jgi:hypothetical protein
MEMANFKPRQYHLRGKTTRYPLNRSRGLGGRRSRPGHFGIKIKHERSWKLFVVVMILNFQTANKNIFKPEIWVYQRSESQEYGLRDVMLCTLADR